MVYDPKPENRLPVQRPIQYQYTEPEQQYNNGSALYPERQMNQRLPPELPRSSRYHGQSNSAYEPDRPSYGENRF